MSINSVKFAESNIDLLKNLEISYSSVKSIILGEDVNCPNFLDPLVPQSAVSYIVREYKACSASFEGFRDGRLYVRSPFSGSEVACIASFLLDLDVKLNTEVLVKKFVDCDSVFYLVYAGMTSRVTHIYIPSLNCVIYDSNEVFCESLAFAIDSQSLNIQCHDGFGKPIAFIDMVSNHAHQVINHLSALSRLIDLGMLDVYGKIYISGIQFFGDVRLIFPELSESLLYIDKVALLNQLKFGSTSEVMKLGSVYFDKNTKQRLLNLSVKSYPYDIPYGKGDCNRPILCFTTRADGRRCLNLVDVIVDIVEKLLVKFPTLGVVIDGWVFPESEMISKSGVVASFHRLGIEVLKRECIEVFDIVKKLPRGVYVGTTVGESALSSINKLQGVDAYLAHIGTLQHKLAWFSNSKGVVHGPKAELLRTDSNWYSCEGAYVAENIDVDCIEDITVESVRGPGFYDYKIRCVDNIVSYLDEVLSSGYK